MAKDFLGVDKGLKHKPESAAISYDAANEGAIYNENNQKMHVQIAGADRELVNTTQAQSLSNKNIDASLNSVLNLTNANIAAGAGIVESKLALNYSTTSLSASNATTAGNLATHIGQSTAHGTTSAIVGISDAQSLTNKHIDATLNDIVNIANANISASAGIVESKLALNYSTTSLYASISAISTSQGGTSGTLAAHIAATAAHGATGANVGTTNTQTLLNKSLDDATSSIVDSSDPTKQIKFDAAGSTSTSTTIRSSQTLNRVLTLPDQTDTLATLTDAKSYAIKYSIVLG